MSQEGTVTIDPAAMIRTAQAIDAQRAIIENCFNSIIRDANSLRTPWEGESSNAYRDAVSRISTNSPKVVSVFREYVLDLNRIASAFMTEEQRRRSRNQALPGNVFGRF